MVAWKKLNQQHKKGGLGIRYALMNNVALLGAQLWGLVQRADKFWDRVVEARYAASPSVSATDFKDRSAF